MRFIPGGWRFAMKILKKSRLTCGSLSQASATRQSMLSNMFFSSSSITDDITDIEEFIEAEIENPQTVKRKIMGRVVSPKVLKVLSWNLAKRFV